VNTEKSSRRLTHATSSKVIQNNYGNLENQMNFYQYYFNELIMGTRDTAYKRENYFAETNTE